MSYSTRITRDTAQRVLDLVDAAGKLLDATERDPGQPESKLTLVGYGETLTARWDEIGNAVVDVVRE